MHEGMGLIPGQGTKKRGKKTELLVEIQTVRAVPVGTPIEQLLVSWFKKKKKASGN